MANAENSNHQELVGFIWSIADKLRGPYRPPQYRKVMLPLIVLRRLDSVLEPTKQAVLEAKAKYEAMGLEGDAFEKAIAKVAIGGDHQQPLYNLSEFTFQKLLNDSEGTASIATTENFDRQYLVRLIRSSIARLQYEKNSTGACFPR